MGITKYDVRNVYIISVTRYTFISVMEDVVCCIDIDIYISNVVVVVLQPTFAAIPTK